MGGCFNKPNPHYGEVTLDYLKNNAQTGDIILVSGESFFSKLIKFVTDTPWTHVGVIVVLNGHRFVFQSLNSSNEVLEDYLENKLISEGVQLNDLEGTILADMDKIYYRKLIRPDNVNEIAFFNRSNAFMKKERTKLYEKDLIELANSVLGNNRYRNTSTYFCSELVAEWFFYTGYATETDPFFPSSNYTPDSFSDTPNREFKLNPPYKFGQIMKIVC